MRRRPIKTTKYNLSKEITDESAKQELTEVFGELETFKQRMVDDQRKAVEALSDYDISKAHATKRMVGFLRKAGEHIPMVAVEPIWWAYRTKDGDIILESAYTERDMRNAQRAQKAGLSREIQSEDSDGMFEQEDNSDSDDDLGFTTKGLPA